MFNHPPIPKLQLKPCLFRVPVSTTRSKPRRITSLSSWTCSNMRMSLAEAKISKRLWSSLAWPAASRAEQPRAKTGGNSGKMWEKCGNNLKMLGGHDESWWKGQKKKQQIHGEKICFPVESSSKFGGHASTRFGGGSATEMGLEHQCFLLSDNRTCQPSERISSRVQQSVQGLPLMEQTWSRITKNHPHQLPPLGKGRTNMNWRTWLQQAMGFCG